MYLKVTKSPWKLWSISKKCKYLWTGRKIWLSHCIKKCCFNYRSISLLYTSYKFLSLIIMERLFSCKENQSEEYKYGFRKNDPTVDQTYPTNRENNTEIITKHFTSSSLTLNNHMRWLLKRFSNFVLI